MSVLTRGVLAGTVDPARLLIELNVDTNVGTECTRVAAFPGAPNDALEIEFVGDPDPNDVDAVLAAHPSTDPIISRLAEITTGQVSGVLDAQSGVSQFLVGWIVPEDSTFFVTGTLRIATGASLGRGRGVEITGSLMSARDGAGAPSNPELRITETGTAPGVILSASVVGNAVMISVSVRVNGTLPYSVKYEAETQANP
jgi:hypothetical protein